MNKIIRLILPVLLLLSGMTMMVLGTLRGELQMILNKAVIVCLECIGIG